MVYIYIIVPLRRTKCSNQFAVITTDRCSRITQAALDKKITLSLITYIVFKSYINTYGIRDVHTDMTHRNP